MQMETRAKKGACDPRPYQKYLPKKRRSPAEVAAEREQIAAEKTAIAQKKQSDIRAIAVVEAVLQQEEIRGMDSMPTMPAFFDGLTSETTGTDQGELRELRLYHLDLFGLRSQTRRVRVGVVGRVRLRFQSSSVRIRSFDLQR